MVPSTSNALGIPLLSIIVFLPLVAALVLSFLGVNERATRIAASVTVVVDFVLAAVMLVKFETLHTAVHGTAGSPWQFQFVDTHAWIPTYGITYWVGVDGIAVFLVGLATLMMAVAVLASNFMIIDRTRTFVIMMLFLETGILGVFTSLNLFQFYVFWEAMLIPMYFLMGMWGEQRRVFATMKFLVYAIFGSFLMLVGIFYLWAQNGTLDMVGASGLIAHPVSHAAQTWLFFAFGAAFAIKLPIWPFHTWAPDAYSESPVPVVIALSGILSKAGAFGFLRYSLPLFPAASREFAGLVSVLAIVGMLYAAVLALVQTDMKRLVSYASISHMNLIALGIFALNATAWNGSVLQMINHSVIISGLFLAVAYIYARTGTRSLAQIGGLGERWPVLMWLFFVFVLAGLDLPGLGSFAGEFLILIGVFRSNAWFSAVAAVTVILAAWYMIRFFQVSMNGPVTASPEMVAETVEEPLRTPYQFPVMRRLIGSDLRTAEVALLVPLILLILYVGIQPQPLTTRINPATTALSSVVRGVTAGITSGGGR